MSRASSRSSALSFCSVAWAERLRDARRRVRSVRQLAVALELRLALLAAAIQLAPHPQDVVALRDHPVPELLDVLHQRFVLAAREIEVLVAGEQVAERLGA